MNTLFHLGLWMMFCIGLVSGIRCSNCKIYPSGGVCRFQKRPCTLYVGMSCYKRVVLYGATPLYTKKGCMQNCKNITAKKEKDTVSVEVKCCSQRNFCNR